MAVRQYIGARYVLKIYENSLDPQSADWEAGVAYEPLVMVNYNNSSYISRKQVPANIGNPVSNPTYWALSGLYNGQIANLQQQINTINANLGTLNPAVSALESGRLRELSDSTFLFLSDSYDVQQDIIQKIAGYVKPKAWTKRSHTGAGFFKYDSPYLQYTWLNMISNLDPLTDEEKATITDICICSAGGNDNPQVDSDLTDAMSAFNTYVKANIPNLKHVYLIIDGWSTGTVLQTQITNNMSLMVRAATFLGWRFYDCTRAMKIITGMISPDDSLGYHPTSTGGHSIAYCDASAILCGSPQWFWKYPHGTVHYTFTFPTEFGTPTINTPSDGTLDLSVTCDSNGVVTAKDMGSTLGLSIDAIDISVSGIKTINLTPTIANTDPFPVGYYAPICMYDDTGKIEWRSAFIGKIAENSLVIRAQAIVASGGITGGHIRAVLPKFVF